MVNKELFLIVYKNKVLNKIINNEIRNIHNKLYKKNNKLNWNQLIKSPSVLAQYGYLHHFKLITKDWGAWRYFDSKIPASKGHLHIIQDIFCKPKERYDLELFNRIFKQSLRGVHIHVIDYLYWFRSRHTFDYKPFIRYALRSGRTEICEWFIEHFNVDSSKLGMIEIHFNKAAASGSIDVLKWLIKFLNNKIKVNDKIWRYAIKSKNIELLEFMYDHDQLRCEFTPKIHIAEAIRVGNLEMIDWIFSKEDRYSMYDIEEILSALVERSSIKFINHISIKLGFKSEVHRNLAEWFYNSCEQHSFNAINLAIENGRFKIMKWIFENTDYQFKGNALEYCKDNSSLEMLKWYTENNRPERIPNRILVGFGFESRSCAKLVEYIVLYRTELIPDILDIILKDPYLFHLVESKYSDDFFKSYISETKHIYSLNAVSERLTLARVRDESAYFTSNDSKIIEWIQKNRTISWISEHIIYRFAWLSNHVKTYIIYNQPDRIPPNVLGLINNDISLSKYIIDTYPTKFINDNSLMFLTQSGNIELVKYLHEHYKKHGINHETNHFNIDAFRKSLESIIEFGFIDIFKYLFENAPQGGLNLFNNSMLDACKIGSLEICKYLQDHTLFKVNSEHMDIATTNGKIEVVKWIYDNHGIKCSDKALESALIYGYFTTARYLLDNNHKLTSDMVRNAIIRSNIEFIKIWEDYRCECDFNIIDLASSFGPLFMVKYLIGKGFKGTKDAIKIAIKNHHLSIIEFLKKNTESTLKSTKRNQQTKKEKKNKINSGKDRATKKKLKNK